MKRIIVVLIFCASSVLAQSPVYFKQGSLMIITNNSATTNYPQLQAEIVDAQQPSKAAKVTLMRESVSVSPIRLVGTQFSKGTKDTNFWTETTTTGGSVVQTNGITLNVDTQLNASATYQSIRKARYISGSANNFRAQVRFCDLGNTNNIRRFGVATIPADDNGAGFGLIGTNFCLFTCYGGAISYITNGTFNYSQWTATTNVQSYEIQYNNGSVEWFCQDILLHKLTAAVKPWTHNMEMGICLQNTNILVVTNANFNGAMEVRVASIQRYGQESTTPIYFNIVGATSNTYKYGAGFLHSVNIGVGGTLCNIYDGTTSLTKMLSIDTSKTTGTLGGFNLDVPFFNGLTVVTTGAGTDIMVVYE